MNGRADTIIRLCSPDRATCPPPTSSTAAMAASATPHTTVVQRRGSGLPFSDRLAMTIDAESALVMKKMTIEIIASTEVIAPAGSSRSSRNSMSWPDSASLSPAPVVSSHIDAPPTTVNHTRHTTLGTTMTVVTNSRRVRPRLILAMNMPTNGVQDTHHAQ